MKGAGLLSGDRMQKEYSTSQWHRLIGLLAPVHDQARMTARRLCRSTADGDDLFQDAVMRAFRKLDSLRDESRFRQWFYAVLVSVHRTRSRRAFWRRFLPLQEQLQNQELVGEDGHDWERKRLQAARVSQALAGLPAVQREALVLYEMDGFSIEEIAAMQNVTASAVKSRLARGRTRLRRHYERLGFGGRLRARASAREGPWLMTDTRERRAAAPAELAFQAALARVSKKVNRHE